jgi:hypothetical protein
VTYTTAVHICRTGSRTRNIAAARGHPFLALALHSSRERIRSGLASTGSPSQAGFKLSAEDLPLRLSATIS